LPSANTHFKIEFYILVPLCYVVFRFSEELPFPETDLSVPVFAGLYLFSSFLLSPDLDMKNSKARKRWSFLSALWIPYSKVFKHRKISHNPIFGPLTRICYLFLLIGLLGIPLTGGAIIPIISNKVSIEWAILSGIALYLPNLIHILIDGIESKIKNII
jgi:uncharacterized metal-binding protein